MAETATAEETAEAGRPGIDAVGALSAKPLDPVTPSPRPGRPGAPVLAGAAIAGLLLVAAPFTVSAGTQGASLDLAPLSGNSLLGVDADNETQGTLRQQAAQPGSAATSPPGGGTVPGTDGNATPNSGDGGDNAPTDPPSDPGYVPEAIEEEPEKVPTGTDGTASGGGGGAGDGDTGNTSQHQVEYGNGLNIASGASQSPKPKNEEKPSADGSGSDGGDRGGKADSDRKPETKEDPETGLGLSLGGDGTSADEDADDKESGGKENKENKESEKSEKSEDGAGIEAPAEEERAAASDEQKAPGTAARSNAEQAAPAGEKAQPTEEPSEETQPAEEPPAEEPAWSYTVTAGPGCDSEASYGRVGVWHSEGGTSGWATRPSGHTADGCDGSYDAIPVSGSAEHGDGQYAYWSFSPGVAGATCELYIHVPDDESPLWIGDQEAGYQIFAGSTAGGSPIAGFGIHQSGIRGGWVQATGFVSPTEQFTVQLTNVGENTLAGQGDTSTHVAASVIRTECS